MPTVSTCRTRGYRIAMAVTAAIVLVGVLVLSLTDNTTAALLLAS